MDNDDRSTVMVLAFVLAFAALVTAAFVSLLRQTRGLSHGSRVGAMARLAAAAMWATLPPRWAVVSLAAGLLAFAGSLTIGIVVTLFVVRLIPPDVPHPTEVYEAFGDAMMAMFRFGIGAMLSLSFAVIVGLIAGTRVASRWGAAQKPNETLQQPPAT